MKEIPLGRQAGRQAGGRSSPFAQATATALWSPSPRAAPACLRQMQRRSTILSRHAPRTAPFQPATAAAVAAAAFYNLPAHNQHHRSSTPYKQIRSFPQLSLRPLSPYEGSLGAPPCSTPLGHPISCLPLAASTFLPLRTLPPSLSSLSPRLASPARWRNDKRRFPSLTTPTLSSPSLSASTFCHRHAFSPLTTPCTYTSTRLLHFQKPPARPPLDPRSSFQVLRFTVDALDSPDHLPSNPSLTRLLKPVLCAGNACRNFRY